MARRRHPPQRRNVTASQTQPKPRQATAAGRVGAAQAVVAQPQRRSRRVHKLPTEFTANDLPPPRLSRKDNAKEPQRRSRRGRKLTPEYAGLPEKTNEKNRGIADRKRKSLSQAPNQPAHKRQKAASPRSAGQANQSHSSPPRRSAPEEPALPGSSSAQEVTPPQPGHDNPEYSDPIDYWRRRSSWPSSYLHPEFTMAHSRHHSGHLSMLRGYHRERRESQSTTNTQLSGRQVPQSCVPDMTPSEAEDATGTSGLPSSQKTDRKHRINVYKKRDFRVEIQRGYGDIRSSFGECATRGRGGAIVGLSPTGKEWREKLLKECDRLPLEDFRFKDDGAFRERISRLTTKNKSERAVIHSLHDLVCPPAEDLADILCTHDVLGEGYSLLADCWNEGWNCKHEIFGTKVSPQPDYCVGFKQEAFEELWHTIKQWDGDRRRLTPTPWMYFPFLTCEAKSCIESPYYADNQNALSMILAIGGVVDLFRDAKCENSIDGEFLGFAVAYNHATASIYGHYPKLNGAKTAIYRTLLCTLQFESCTDRWKIYKLVRCVYEDWAPMHFRRLYEAVETIRRIQDAADGSGGRPRAAVSNSATPTPSLNRMALASNENTPEPSAARNYRNAQSGGVDAGVPEPPLAPLPQPHNTPPVQSVEEEGNVAQRIRASRQNRDGSGTAVPPVSRADGEPLSKKRKRSHPTDPSNTPRQGESSLVDNHDETDAPALTG